MQPAYNSAEGTIVPRLALDERVNVEGVAAKDALKVAVAVWLVLRIVLSLWGALIFAIAPPRSYDHVRRAYPDVVLPDHDLYGYTIGLWNLYDTRHYITIAERGYEADPAWLPAYFPAYPLMIKAVSPLLLGDSLLAALVISNLCAIIFFWYLYRLIEPEYGPAVAKRAVILAAAFPASFFLFMGYTEAPLLAFMVASIYYARQRKWWLAGLLAAVATLIKQPGILLLAPLVYMYWQQRRASGLPAQAQAPTPQKWSWAWLSLSPLAFLAYSLYRYLYISAPLPGFADISSLLWFRQSTAAGSQGLTFPGLPLLGAILTANSDNPLLPYNLMDIGFTLLMVALLIGISLKIRSTAYRIFALSVGLVNMSVYMWTYAYRPEANMPRRLLLIFPIFLLLAIMLPERRAFRMVIYTSMVLFLSLSALFTNWIFIS